MQFIIGLPNLKELSPVELYTYIGDENKAAVETVGVCRLKLDSGFVLDLNETLYVPSFRRNLFLFHY